MTSDEFRMTNVKTISCYLTLLITCQAILLPLIRAWDQTFS